MSDETKKTEDQTEAAPKTDAGTEAPPKAEAGAEAAPAKAEAAPKADAPKADAPKADAPKAEAKKADEDKSLEAKLAAATGQDDQGERLDPQAAKEARKAKKAEAQQKAGNVPKGKKQAKGGGGKGKKGKKGKKDKFEPFVKRTAAPRLKQKYVDEILPALRKEFNFSSAMAVPRLMKITVNMGLGEALQNPKLLDSAEAEMAAIAGQKPVVTKARQSIAAFKLRQGQKIGCMVTLRRDRMYEFFDRLVSFALPRTRDFRGVSPRSFDGRGNFALGIKEQIIFPEIDYDKIEKIMGLNVSIVTSAKNDEEGRALLKHLGMPFRK